MNGSPNPYDHGGADGEFEYFDHDLVAGFFHRLELILDECPIDFYVSSSNAHPWPYRLQHVNEANPAAFHASPTNILDSDIMSPSVGNERILERATELNANYVVAKDYMPFDTYYEKLDSQEDANDWEAVQSLEREYGDNLTATAESIREFAELYNPKEHPTPLIPLQVPYDEHYREIQSIIKDSELEEKFVLGGLKDGDPKRQLSELETLRFVVGNDAYLHGLGWGLPPVVVERLRADPWLLDSVDNSTPCKGYRNGKLVDKNWNTIKYDHVTGEWATAVGGLAEMLQLAAITHRLTPLSNDVAPLQSTLVSSLTSADGGWSP